MPSSVHRQSRSQLLECRIALPDMQRLRDGRSQRQARDGQAAHPSPKVHEQMRPISRNGFQSILRRAVTPPARKSSAEARFPSKFNATGRDDCLSPLSIICPLFGPIIAAYGNALPATRSSNHASPVLSVPRLVYDVRLCIHRRIRRCRLC